MAGSKSNFLENAVLDAILGKSSTYLSTGTGGVESAAPSTVFVALYASTINDGWTATSTGECAGSTYARVGVANSSANWTNASAGAKENKTTIEFTTSAGSDWGTVKAFALLTSSSTTAGEVLYWGDLTSSQTISSGNVVRFSTGAIDITED